MFVHELSRYIVTRILNMRIFALWLLLTTLTVWTSSGPFTQWPLYSLSCALFILGFRLWDDLSDLRYDREQYPDRLLVQTERFAYFYATLWTVVAVLTWLVFVTLGADRALIFLAIIAAFWVLYRLNDFHPLSRSARGALVPVKYPLFILLLATDPGSLFSIMAGTGIYIAAVLDEMKDNGVSVLWAALPLTGAIIGVWMML